MEEWGVEAGNAIVDRYVHSLYEVGKRTKSERRIAKELALVKNTIIEVSGYKKLLKRVSFLSEEGLKFADFLKKNLKLSAEVSNFLNLLLHNNRFGMIIEICDAYTAYLDRLDGKKLLYLTLAKEQTKTSMNELLNNLRVVFGNKIECVTRIDPAIKDGFKLQYQSKVLDYSLKSKLRRLRTAIRRDSYEN